MPSLSFTSTFLHRLGLQVLHVGFYNDQSSDERIICIKTIGTVVCTSPIAFSPAPQLGKGQIHITIHILSGFSRIY